MKRISILFVLVLLVGAIFAQNPIAVGQTQLNAGVGFSSWGIPVYLGLDYGVHKDITMGGQLSYNSYRDRYQSYHYNHSILGIAGNANYHFNHVLKIPTNWDFYAGLSVGFYIWDSPDSYHGSNSSGLGISGQVGGRYYFNDKFGVNLEFGGGNAFSGGKLGLSMKL